MLTTTTINAKQNNNTKIQIQNTQTHDQTNTTIKNNNNTPTINTNNNTQPLKNNNNTPTTDTNKNTNNKNSTINMTQSIKASNITKYYAKKIKYTTTLYNLDHQPLKNTKITIKIQTQKYTIKTNKQGKATLTLKNLKPGTYKITIHNPNTNHTTTQKITIQTTLKTQNLTKIYKDNHHFQAQTLNTKGKPTTHQKITFTIQNQKHTILTNKKGKETLTLNHLKPGTYKITTKNTNGQKNTNTIKIKKESKTTIQTTQYTYHTKNKKSH